MQLKRKLEALPGYVRPPAKPGERWSYVAADCSLWVANGTAEGLLREVYVAYGMGALA